MNAPLGPRIPVVNVQIGSAHTRGLDAHQHLAGSGRGNRHFAQLDAGRGLGLHNGLHGGGHSGGNLPQSADNKSINRRRVVERCRELKTWRRRRSRRGGTSISWQHFCWWPFLPQGSMARAQTEDQAWLRYASGPAHSAVPASVRALGTSVLEQSAVAGTSTRHHWNDGRKGGERRRNGRRHAR